MFACQLIIEEVLTNVVKYAHDDGSLHEILFDTELKGEHIVLRITDDGREFNPLTVPLPDPDLPLEERPIGRLGIHLVRNFADRVEYARTRDCNVLTIFVRRF